MNKDLFSEKEINIKEIWRILHNYRKSILAIFFLAILASIFISSTTQPIYNAVTSVMLKQSAAEPSSFVFDFGMGSSQQRLQNEIELLNSYNLHDQVIQSLIDDRTSDELSLFGNRLVKKRFQILKSLGEWVGNGSKSETHRKIISPAQRIKIVNRSRRNTTISKVREADVLKISVNSANPDEAVFLANRISKVYRNLDLAGGQGELHFVLTFLDSQITQHKQRLVKVEEELREFQSSNMIYSLDGSADLLLADLTKYESTYYINIAELKVAQQRVTYLEGQLSESEKALMTEITNTNNPMIVALRSKIAELEAQKIQQMVDEGWNNQSLQAKNFDRRIAEMKSQLTDITESMILSGWSDSDPFAASQEIFNRIVEQEVEVYSARARSIEYKKLVDILSDRLKELPNQTLEYARLERELRLSENLYLTMKQKYEESRITEAGQRGKVRILDPAVSASKIKPDRNRNLIYGIMFGLSLGVGLAFLREFLDSTIKAVEQLERKGLTILGIIPDMMQKGGKPAVSPTGVSPSKGGASFKRRLITHEDPKSPISESFRSLRTNVNYASAEGKIKSLVISSPQPGEGKSTTTANLAIAFAQLRKRTLLVDADLRKPVQHNVFDFPRGPGLSEYLIGDVIDLKSIIQQTEIDNLFLITAGSLPPNPSELVGSDQMRKLVDNLTADFDVVLFDSPPIVAVTDASLIAAVTDGLALVVKAGVTDKSAVDRALDTVKNVRSKLTGAILNSVNPETLSGKYSYYYSYYQYYYHAEDGTKKSKSSKKLKSIRKLFTS
ncbi:MAG: polysaccharide biosynthesis tyrosine autokinase [Candidatus Marinimicrobia bacterium]|nr:polysaccharide biosynthesis tyrosine autokinase [Candidatus Neomarinimicrobiota bacterium]